MKLNGFKELGLSDMTLKELRKKGFEEPTEIQVKIIPLIMNDDADIIGQAQTGTGKTAAFGLPMVERMKKGAGFIQSLVLVPTRELAVQVSEEINSFRGKSGLRIIPVYGGQSLQEQQRRLREGVDIVIGTPGRVLDHINRGNMELRRVSLVVLDEADEMLNMGFIDEVEEILGHAGRERRTLLFSATMPDRIMGIARRHMREYRHVTVKAGGLTVESTDQIYFEVSEPDRFEALCRIIDVEKDFYGLVFCRTKVSVDELVNRLIDRGYNAEGLHGDLSQHQRERILEKFRKQRITILAATDVAARGIDVANLSHVINYSLPQDPESYVHRIGRTGRAGRSGIAITFITPEEQRKLTQITMLTKTSIRKEKLPGISEVIRIKQASMEGEIRRLIDEGEHRVYLKTALGLLDGRDPGDVVAALLKHSLDDVLNEGRYREIPDAATDARWKTRLFVSFGRKDGFNTRKLIKLINNRTRVPAGKISEVRVMESYSFLTVPFQEAEIILRELKGGGDSSLPLVKIANEMKTKGKKRK